MLKYIYIYINNLLLIYMNSFLGYTDKQSYYPNEIINIYSHYPGATSYTDISKSINFQSVFNSWTTNQKTTIIKQNNSLKCG